MARRSQRHSADRASRSLDRLQVGIALGCFFGSGLISLVYEICWIRKASLVFGAATFALSTVLAVFFAGLALGSYVFGRISQRHDRPLLLYAGVEFALGILGLASPWGFRAADVLFSVLYPMVEENFALLSLVRFLLVSVILLPAAVLIGGTLPLFCRHFVRREDRITRSVGTLYGINTIGAAVGCAACGFYCIPLLGVDATIYLAGTLNLVIALIMWRLPSSHVAPAPDPGEKAPQQAAKAISSSTHQSATVVIVSALFFFSGFVALGSEVLWARYLTLLMHNTVYTYTLTLTVVLLGIVLGSFFAARLLVRSERYPLIFGAAQVANGIFVLLVLMLPAAWWAAWRDPANLGTQISIVTAVLLVPAVLSGITFPLAMAMVVRRVHEAGLGVGKMTAVNTVGGIAGSLAVGFFILPSVGLQNSLLLVTALSLMIGVTAWLLLARGTSLLLRGGLIVASGAVWAAIPPATGTRLPEDFLAPRQNLVDFREGLASHMAIVRKGDTLRLEIDRLWQGQDDKTQQVMAAHVPMMLHHDPKRVLVIGIGPGQTASRFLMYPVDQLDCVDIESELVPLVKEHFDSAWMDDRRVRFLVEDGRNYIAHTRRQYDLISIEVGQAFRPGVASFYTAEFYHLARRRLRAEGLLCQFVEIGYFSPADFRTVIRTFLDAFPHSVLWYNRSELLLIGTVGEALTLSPQRLALLDSADPIREDLKFAHWGGPAHWLNHPEMFLAGFLAAGESLGRLAARARVYHDDRPHLEYSTSTRQRAERAAVVNLIRDHLDSPSVLVEGGLDATRLRAVRENREKNISDIVVRELIKPVDDLRASGHFQQAFEILDEALRWNPESFRANLLLGEVYLARGEYANASGQFRKAIRIDPGNPQVHNNLGISLQNLGQTEEAITHYRRALELRREFVEAHNNLAVALKQEGQTEEALAHFREVIRLDPTFYPTRYGLDNAVILQGNW